METLHQPNDIINGRYRIVTPLGQGSTGTTYEAEDLTNYQRVAIKAVSLRQATDWKILELFEREARVLANLNHPNIPNYLDYFYVDTIQDRIFYLVRELIGGDSLANLVQRGWNLEEEKVKQITIQVLQTLDYLHRLNPPIIHRDIKPENLIVDRSGKVFLVDFGAVADVYRQTISSSNTFVGTLGYMAPEQFRGKVKPASDLYSLGATLVFVLTRRSPIDLPQVRMKIDFRNRVSISPHFADWLDKMLEPMLEDRFSSAREALDGVYYGIIAGGYRQFVSQNKTISNMVTTRRPQPAGSQIVLINNGTDLFVEIPSTQREMLPSLHLFAVCLVCILFASFTSEPPLLALLCVLMSSVSHATRVLLLVLGKRSLKVNADKLCLEWVSSSGLVLWRREILTRDIDKIGLSKAPLGSKTRCTIWQGVRSIDFAENFSKTEQKWLVEEIKYFLKQIRQ